jgi:L-threonylcarbamoyladenylate synthase
MEHLLVDPRAPDETVVARAARILLDGGIVAYPTDTLYGLGVDPRDARAVQRLFAVKQRSGTQPIPLIAADQAQVEREVGRLNPLARRLAAAFWPGPLTLVIAAFPAISSGVHDAAGHVGVRVPAHAVARMLAARAGCAITSTSANLSGEPPPDSPAEVLAGLGAYIDALLDAGPAPGGLPSTIVDTTHGAPALVREGVVPWARVLECV